MDTGTRPERKPVVVLDDQTINRIAAGEVVERPAAAVKELIENSLDAGASRVEVEVEMGGRKLIRVRDDGIGMGQEDAMLALQRHATSKIANASDLFEIRTMGFRGEAMPSIASVSRMELVSRPAESETGVRIVVEGGEIKSVEETGALVGTSITVRDLFYNVPARLKFLKTVPTELGHILETVVRYAFAYPHVSFRLIHEKQELVFTPGNSDLVAVVAATWGRDIARNMVALDHSVKGIHAIGLISPPHATRPTRQHQLFYVNRRPVRNKTLTAALDESYKSLTPEKRYPACVIMVELEPKLVDVNVHPAKIEVKFQREGDLFEAVYHAVRNTLLEHGMIPSAIPQERAGSREWGMGIGQGMPGPPPQGSSSRPQAPASSGGRFTVPDAETLHSILLQRVGLDPPSETAVDIQDPFADLQPEQAAPREIPEPEREIVTSPFPQTGTLPSVEETVISSHLPFGDLLDGLQILGQIADTFIVASTRKGLVIIDQHVAHERVLYEQLCDVKGSAPIPRQHLLEPDTLTLDKRSALLLSEKMDELNRIGFELEAFGADTFLVRAIPAALIGRNYMQALRDMVDELVELSVTKRLPVAREQIWTTTSCKMAVKAGDPLNMPEMKRLIEDLARTENPYLCPHGRPITLTLTWEELEKRFKRT